MRGRGYTLAPYHTLNTHVHPNRLLKKKMLLSRLAVISFSFLQSFSGVYRRHSCYYTVE